MTLATRALLDNELNEINQAIQSIGSMVDTAIGNAVESLMTGNGMMAQTVIAGDADINRLRFLIEEKCYVVLATQQPMARDLRTVIAAIHFAIELERIGDHAAGIARIVTRMAGMPLPLPPNPAETEAEDEVEVETTVDESQRDDALEAPPEPPAADEPPPKRLKLSRLPKMAKRARDMLNRAVAAYMERDVEMAMAIVKRDQKINRQYRKFFAEAMQTLNTQHVAEMPTYLLWIAHNLERIGDRTTNLAERVIFMVTGQYTEVVEEYE